MIQVKKGDRVKPFQKSTGCTLIHSNEWKLACKDKQDFLYVNGIRNDNEYTLGRTLNAGGDYFRREDFTPIYEEGFQKGDRVVPHAKTSGTKGLENSRVWSRARNDGQMYLYITNIRSNGQISLNNEQVSGGDFFNVEDFTLYGDVDALQQEHEDAIMILENKLQMERDHAKAYQRKFDEVTHMLQLERKQLHDEHEKVLELSVKVQEMKRLIKALVEIM